MGSLTKRPKIPKQVPPVRTVYVPAPVNTPVSDTDAATSAAENKSEAKKQRLLRRARGRLGTVLTGFRGLLNDTDTGTNNSGRKTLLGE